MILMRFEPLGALFLFKNMGKELEIYKIFSMCKIMNFHVDTIDIKALDETGRRHYRYG